MKRLLGILLSLILLTIPIYADDGGYSIDSYNVAIQVGEDNIFNIKEDISVYPDNIYYAIEGNSIIGFYEGVLNPNEGIAVRIELPEGYFNTITSHINWNINLNRVKMIPLGTLVMAIALWLIFARNRKGHINACPYPPEGYNSAEIGIIYTGKADNKAVVSLLFGLAQKGYLKIINFNVKTGNSKSSFACEKLMPYKGEDKAEKIFFQRLFKNRERVEENKLYDRFYTAINQIKKVLDDKSKREGFFTQSSRLVKLIVTLVTLISYALVMAMSWIYGGGNMDELIAYTIFTGAGLWIILFFIGIGKFIMGIKEFILSSIFVIMGIIFVALPTCTFASPMLINYPELTPIIVMNMVCFVLILMIIKKMKKRTPYGQKLYIQIRGFIEYIKKVDEETLIKLRESNPNYFYEILPYMMALGISKRNTEKFNLLATVSPMWYESIAFNSCTFHQDIYRVMQVAERSMISTPDRSEGSDRSNEGFSGGSFGGGGGGSW